MLTFQDIFKSDFLSSVDSISLVDIALALVLSFALGLFISSSTKRPTWASCTPPASA